MMKLLSLAAIAGAAAAAEERPPQRRRLVGPRPDGAESTTRRFAGDAPRRDARALQRGATRRHQRHGKGGKGSGDRWAPEPPGPAWSDDDYHGSKGGKNGGGGGGGGKSGKYGDDDWADDDWHHGDWGHSELFYVLPTACPHECVSSHVTGDQYEFIDAIKQCRENDESQMWLVRSDGSYIVIESYHQRGMCMAVDYEHGDGESMLAKTCYNGELVLKDCRSDHGTEWYFTGGQLVNALCWGAGLSSMMTVFLEAGKNSDVILECKKDVAVWGANDEAILKSDTFLFVTRLPSAPFRIEDVNEAIEKTTDSTTKSTSQSKSRMGTPKDVEGST